MEEVWKEYETQKLGDYILDIAAGPFGSNLKVECFVPSGFPIIDGANLRGFKVTDNVTKFVTEEKARSLYRSIAKRNDVVVTISGNVGQISYIPNNSKYKEYLVSQRQFRATFDTTKVYVPYLIYYFHTIEGQHKILSFANQTGVPALAQPLKNFKNIDVQLPPLSKQKQIASILSSIDDKIECNQRINDNLPWTLWMAHVVLLLLKLKNDNLEKQAQALFKSWFIDFEPFKDGKFVDSEIGRIPYGWKVATIDDVLKLKRQAIKREFDNSLPYLPIDIIPMKSLGIDGFKSNDEAQSSLQMFEKDDIIIGAMRVYFHRVVIAPQRGITRNTCFVLEPKLQNSLSFCALLCNKDEVIDHANRTSKGSTMPYAVWEGGLNTFKFALPPTDIICKFESITKQMLGVIRDGFFERVQLAKLRDTLLPLLMSGKLKISDLN